MAPSTAGAVMKTAKPLLPKGRFTSVSAGGSHTCGVRTDGTIDCWGLDLYGEASPPEGQFASVSAGQGHTCGVRPRGDVVCWGSDEDGQNFLAPGAVRLRQRRPESQLRSENLRSRIVLGL